jgi:23S rRNA (guanosine2251-2'-O)-methyltransferase
MTWPRPPRRGGRTTARPRARGDDQGGRAAAPPSGDVLYGRNPVREALRAGRRRLHMIWATPAAAREPWLAGRDVTVVDADEIAERAASDAHQGVCALADPYPYADAAELLRRTDPWLVVLDEVQDPQNVGAICRTAECAGADGVILPERRSAEVTPAVCKASAGAVEWLAVARVRNVADFLGQARAAGCWSYGAAAAGGAVPYTEPDWRGGVVLVMGAEGKGLRPRVAAACDQLVALPLRGHVESLNVSAAAAVLLYEILQRREAA